MFEVAGVSPEEWAFKISELIKEAEADGMEVVIAQGDLYVWVSNNDPETVQGRWWSKKPVEW